MSASRTVSPAEERLLDAALQQLFAGTSVGAAARTTTRRSPHWLLVAMLLLGLGVTATLMCQAREVQRDEVQDPNPREHGEEVLVRSRAELDALPATTTHIRWFLEDPRELPAIERFQGILALRLVPQEGTLLGLRTGYHRSWTDAPADLLQPLVKLKQLAVLGLPQSLAKTSNALAPLADHPTLHTLELAGMRLAQESLPSPLLERIPNLRTIQLTFVTVDAALLRELARLPLTALAFRYCRIDAEAWATLCTMRPLQSLSFTGWSWVRPERGEIAIPARWIPSPADLQRLRQLPDLHALELVACNVDGAQLAALPRTLRGLRLFGHELTPTDLESLGRFDGLRELTVDTRRNSYSIETLFDADPIPQAEAVARAIATLRLQCLDYRGALVPELAKNLAAQAELRELSLDGQQLPIELLASLLANMQLESLRLRRTVVSNQHQDLVPTISGQTQLRRLELPVDDLDSLPALAKLPKLEHLTLRIHTARAARQAIDAVQLAPLARSASLLDVELQVSTNPERTPLPTQAMQQALGARIRLHVRSL